MFAFFCFVFSTIADPTSERYNHLVKLCGYSPVMSLIEQELSMNLSTNGDATRNSSFIFYGSGISAADAIIFKFSEIISMLNIAVYFFAVAANTVIILVLLKDGFKLTSNICFFALAINDLLISIVWIIWLLVYHGVFSFSVGNILMYICNVYLLPCGEAIHSIGSWITMIVTLERLCCVMFPLKVTTLQS